MLLTAAAACGAGAEPAPPIRADKAGAAPIRDGQFVHAVGTGFEVGGEPFRVVGANAAVMHGETVREEAPRLLDAMREDGIRVVRVWALGEVVEDDGASWRRDYAFRLGPESWVEESFVHVDRVLAEARERDIRVVLVLANRWADYGGLSTYARWIGIEPRRRHLLHAELGVVLRDERARALYRAHVERLVTRRSSITGEPYREDPTIFAWELANELSTGTCATADAVRDWTAEMSAFVRDLDPNHLVAAGHGGYHTELGRETWREVSALPHVGYADFHAYPENVVGLRGPSDLGPWAADRSGLARDALGKPLVIGEIGFPRDDTRFRARAEWLDGVLALADGAGVAAVLPWIYRPWDGRDDRHGIWAWGPHAESTEPLRQTLKWWASRWAGRRPEVAAAGVHASDPDPRAVAPYVEGTWEELRGGRWAVSVDPWALAEGCARDGEEAWARYVLRMEREEAPSSLEVTALGPRRPAASPLGIHVAIDGVLVGTWDGPGAFRPAGPEALAGAFAEPRRVRFLRLSTDTTEGRTVLRRFTAGLPGDETLGLRVAWPPR